MKKIKLYVNLVFIVAVCCLLTFSVHAETIDSGTCGADIRWELSNDGTLVISGNGKMDDYVSYDNASPWYRWETMIETVVISKGITNIGTCAFAQCDRLQSVSLPEELTGIGDEAFYGCDKLTGIKLPSELRRIGNYTFGRCTGLMSIDLPEGLRSIGDGAFSSCYSLKSIQLPEEMTILGSGVFDDCDSLKNANLPGKLKMIGQHIFSGCDSLTNVSLPKELKSIPASTFACCSSLTSISLPEELESIGDYAFAGCDNLTGISLPEGLKNIEQGAFVGCAFKEIEIPVSVSSISSYAIGYDYKQEIYNTGGYSKQSGLTIVSRRGSPAEIYAAENSINFREKKDFSAESGFRWELTDYGTLYIYCRGEMEDYTYINSCNTRPWKDRIVSKVILYDGITHVGDNAFTGLGLIDVDLPDGLTDIGKYAFSGCCGLRNVNLPEGLKSIGESAFGSCEDMTGICLPESLENIGERAFEYCYAMKSISLPEDIKSIGSGAFSDCKNLEKVSLPKKLKKIESFVFNHCISLKDISLPEGLESIGANTFCHSGLKNVHLPNGLKSIGYDAFLDCTFKEIEIPESVTSIDSFAVGYKYDGEKHRKISGFTIIGKKGTVAETYARENGFTFKDQDGTVVKYTMLNRTYTSGQFKYKVTGIEGSSGTVTVVGTTDKTAASITVPPVIKIEGIEFKVTAIANRAFHKMPKLKSAILGSGITKIGEAAFSESGNLDRITLQTKFLETVGKNALKGIAKRTVIEVEKGKADEYGKLFTKETGFTSKMEIREPGGIKTYLVTFKNGEKTVKTQKVKNGEAASAPELVKEGYTLNWDKAFKKVTKDITVKAVWKPVLVKKGYTMVKNGLKYKVTKSSKSKGMVQLTGTSSKKKTSYTVPATVKIGKYQFKVTGIATEAFKGCNKAKKISLPKTITSVGKNAFAKVSSRLRISVPKAQYKKISKMIKASGINKKVVIKKR